MKFMLLMEFKIRRYYLLVQSVENWNNFEKYVSIPISEI